MKITTPAELKQINQNSRTNRANVDYEAILELKL
jgi:hypothetical protein